MKRLWKRWEMFCLWRSERLERRASIWWKRYMRAGRKGARK